MHSSQSLLNKTCFLFAAIFLLLFSLSAQNTTSPSTPPADLPGKDLYLVFIGNSITAGAGLQNRVAEAPPVHAAAFLREWAGIRSVEYSNQGVSGFTTVDFLPATNTVFKRVVTAAQIFAEKDGILIFSISLGTNDSAIQGPNGSPVSPSSYHNNLKTISDSLLKLFPTSLIVIQQPIWYSPNTYNSSKYLAEGLARLQSYFPEIDLLVNEYGKTLPGRVFLGDTNGFGYFEANSNTDLKPEPGNQGVFYLHPNAKGAVVLGQLWGTAIAHALGK